MVVEQLVQRYFELKQDLAVAYNTTPWQTGRINQLADQLALAEREIGTMQRALFEPELHLLEGRSAHGVRATQPTV